MSREDDIIERLDEAISLLERIAATLDAAYPPPPLPIPTVRAMWRKAAEERGYHGHLRGTGQLSFRGITPDMAMAMSDAELLRVRGFGPVVVAELRAWLR